MSVALTSFVDQSPTFRTHSAVREPIQAACDRHSDIASFHELGQSEGGRSLYGVLLGTGPRTVSLIAGNHADEPVGPETLRSFILGALARRDEMAPWFRRYQFVVVPHTNPDGEERNRPWMEQWPDPQAYLQHAVREKPGRDIEFGFPDMRAENERVSAFLQDHAPCALHMSLHGMAVGEGAMLLINRPWTFRTQSLRDEFREAVRDRGFRMHDHNRKGEKGFFWIESGFQTTPRGDAMRTYFEARGNANMARRFHQSSMEFVMSLGGDPLALVTEVPLFVVRNDDPTPGQPDEYLRLRDELPEIRARVVQGHDVSEDLERFGLRPVPLATGMHLQLRALELGLTAVQSSDGEQRTEPD